VKLALSNTIRLLAVSGVLLLVLVSSTLEACVKLENSEESPVDDAVRLKIGQSGFAGVSGYIYTIDNQGHWTIQSFLNEKVNEVASKGSLPGDQLDSLHGLVNSSLELQSNCSPPFMYPLSIELSHGSDGVSTYLTTAATIAPCHARKDTNCALVNIAAWLEMHLVPD